jgi:hypothetical protein
MSADRWADIELPCVVLERLRLSADQPNGPARADGPVTLLQVGQRMNEAFSQTRFGRCG